MGACPASRHCLPALHNTPRGPPLHVTFVVLVSLRYAARPPVLGGLVGLRGGLSRGCAARLHAYLPPAYVSLPLTAPDLCLQNRARLLAVVRTCFDIGHSVGRGPDDGERLRFLASSPAIATALRPPSRGACAIVAPVGTCSAPAATPCPPSPRYVTSSRDAATTTRAPVSVATPRPACTGGAWLRGCVLTLLLLSRP